MLTTFWQTSCKRLLSGHLVCLAFSTSLYPFPNASSLANVLERGLSNWQGCLLHYSTACCNTFHNPQANPSPSNTLAMCLQRPYCHPTVCIIPSNLKPSQRLDIVCNQNTVHPLRHMPNVLFSNTGTRSSLETLRLSLSLLLLLRSQWDAHCSAG